MGNPFLELFFPRFCVGCGYVGTYICPLCEAKMKRANKEEHCFYCDKPSLFGITHPRCSQKKGIDGYCSLYSYEGLFKSILQESKYKGAHAILNSLLSFPQPRLTQTLYKWKKLFNPLTLSVPLHPQRIRKRGFNQSEIIERQYFEKFSFSGKKLLERKKNTDHLATIGDKSKRKKHIRGAFGYIGEKPPETVLLIDDVVTSGSTVLECAKELKENGVQVVLAFSLAKG